MAVGAWRNTMTATSDADAGYLYRLAQIRKILDLFAAANGRPAKTVEELEQWIGSPQGRKATAYHQTKDGKIIP
jgi:hypothetical protein